MSKEKKLKEMQSLCHDTLEFWNSKNIKLSDAIGIMPYLYAELFQNSHIRDLEIARKIQDMSKSTTLSMLASDKSWK